ncbi:MAG: transporter [Subdoligranulum variabile]|nr:MAG: transporter [Subdoligranulum variabile]
MLEVLARAACFAAVIVMGCLLRRVGFFKAGDFDVLARIVTRITLPAAIVVSFSGREVDASMLIITALGFAFGVVYMLLGFLMNLRAAREKRAFEILNISGYNIGNFTLPFAQSFLGPAGVVTASLFDTGNAVICLGGAYSVASMVKQGSRFSASSILKKLLHSVPFCTYLVMIVLALTHLALPGPVVEFAGILADANAFMAMLMLGVGFQLSGSRSQLLDIARILAVRYAVAVAAALACYFLVPLALEYRQALALLVFSPISSVAPAFTSELKSDVGLASAVNSMSVLFSIIGIVTVLSLVL